MNKIKSISGLCIAITLLAGCNGNNDTSTPIPPPPPSPNYLVWTTQAGASGGYTFGYGASTDNNGDVYTTGTTSVGINGQTQNGTYDYFLSKYTTSGTLDWSIQLGANQGFSSANAVTTNTNNVYITGSTTQALDQQTQNGTVDAFIANYDNNGNLIWLKQLGASTGTTEANSVVDQSGNIAIAGYTTVGINGQTQHGNEDYFISQYNSTGSPISTIQDGATGGNSVATGVTTRDGTGNFYVVGSTTVGLDGQTQEGNTDAFITQYTSNNTRGWTQQFGGANGITVVRGVAMDNDGNIYVVGDTNVPVGGQTQIGYYDYFVSKYSSDGTREWTQQLGAISGQTFASGITIDSNGELCVAGYTNAGLDGQTQHGDEDYFVSYFTADGVLMTTFQNGNTQGFTRSRGIASDQSGNVYLTGQTNVGLDGQIQNGNYDSFLAKYNYVSGS